MIKITMVTLLDEYGEFIKVIKSEGFHGNVGEDTIFFNEIEGVFIILFNSGAAAVVQRKGTPHISPYDYYNQPTQQWER